MINEHAFLQELGPDVKRDEPLARYTTLKIGGPADYFLEVRQDSSLLAALRTAAAHHVAVTLLGGGTNVLIADAGIRGLVIRNLTDTISIRGVKGVSQGNKSERLVFVEASGGVSMNKLVRFTVEEGLAGLEMHLGLPGSVGGAVYMNSKWTHPDGYVGDCVYQASVFSADGQVRTEPASYFRFGYDTSSIQKTKETVLSVVFALRQADKQELWRIANESIAYRRSTQPQGVSSPGCTFQNISTAQAIAHSTPNLTTSAGFLIDRAGLKGVTVGDAQISPVHANFIVNRGAARASDVVELIEKTKQTVKDMFGIHLREEIVYLGDFTS